MIRRPRRGRDVTFNVIAKQRRAIEESLWWSKVLLDTTNWTIDCPRIVITRRDIVSDGKYRAHWERLIATGRHTWAQKELELVQKRG